MSDDVTAGEDEIEAAKAPLLEHLLELRKRLIYSMVTLLVAFIGCYLVAEQIYGFLVSPLADLLEGQGRRMIFTGLHEAFFTYLKVSLFGAFCISFPLLTGQIWAFVAPGLYKREKMAMLPFMVASPVLFTMGAALVYYMVFPLAWSFFLSFETPGGPGMLPIQLEAKVNEYLSLVMKLIFAFGISFQLPVLLTLLARVGIVSSTGLAKNRKYAIVCAFAFAAVLTPPDIISQIGLGVPILVLYEISILSAKMIERKRAEADAAAGRGED